MRFLLLIHGDEVAERALTADARGAIMAEHVRFADELRAKGALVAGDALADSREAAVVRPRGSVTDGPFAETKEQLGGYYVVECADRDAAIELARGVPDSPGAAVEIRQLLDM
jgi:hypothetical protein